MSGSYWPLRFALLQIFLRADEWKNLQLALQDGARTAELCKEASDLNFGVTCAYAGARARARTRALVAETRVSRAQIVDGEDGGLRSARTCEAGGIAMRDAQEQHNGKSPFANDRGVIVPPQCKVIHLKFLRRHQSYRSIEISPPTHGRGRDCACVFQLH